MTRLLNIFSIINEAHHEYDNPDFNTKFHPVKTGDTFRVFHGFRDEPDAINAVTRGLSGKSRANRAYSPEANHNPSGLFVSLSLKTAQEFGGTIIEFDCSLDELEAPVWPGGSYTVQGQMSQYFPNEPRDNRIARIQQRKNAEKDTERDIAGRKDLDHIKNSDQKYLAYLLTNSSEYQALYIGHLDPKRIKAVYVRNYVPYQGSTYKKMTPQEFLHKNPAPDKTNNSSLLFEPYEEFSEKLLWDRLAIRYKMKDRPDLEKTIAKLWGDVVKSPNQMGTFRQYFGQWVYPKQLSALFNWMKRKFKNSAS